MSCRRLILYFITLVYTCIIGNGIILHAQVDTVKASKDSVAPFDVGDLLRKILKKPPPEPDSAKSKGGMTLLPSLGYNPSFGFFIGATITGGRQLGSKENTTLSIFNLSGSISTLGIITFKARHNISLPENKWNLQGDWEISRMGITDYGTGITKNKSRGFAVNEYSTEDGDSTYPMKYGYVQLYEKVYGQVLPGLFAGVGVSFDLVFNIKDEKYLEGLTTPHQVYSQFYGFDLEQYATNGLIIGVLYNTRDHPLRPYRGVYLDLNVQFNTTWLGSTENSVQLMYDLRKYFSLSKRNPEHVLALWHWAAYDFTGEIPYLLLPGTNEDMFGRSGRGYTFGRFKGPSYACFEAEYRFPITKNKFISGVGFYNLQTASNGLGEDIFKNWASGWGIGLRILFDKRNRTNLCVDIANGNYGSRGVFFGLNEVF